jgi:hypothetical protein
MLSLAALIIVLLGAGAIVWMMSRWLRSSRRADQPQQDGYAIVPPNQASVQPYPYIYVNSDGTARELHANERNYLEAEFHPCDSGRPYVKSRYSQKDGWGDIGGYLRRSRLPAGTQIYPAPTDDPNKPLSREEEIRFLRNKGVDVIEHSDGSFTARKPDSTFGRL